MAKKMAVRNKEEKEHSNKFWNKTKSEKHDENNSGRSRGLRVGIRVLGSSFGVFLLVLGAIQVSQLWSSIWPVKNVLLASKEKHINEAEIAKILSVKNTGGMLSIDLVELHKDLLSNPWVKAVTIRKQWPDTLSFELQEFEPIARINDMLLLESGVRVIEKDKDKDINTNANLLNIIIDKSRIGAGLDLLKLVNQIEDIESKLALHHLELKTFEIDEINNWFIHLNERFGINLGRQKQQQRMERFFTVFAAIENKLQLEHIDLRYRNGLSVKYKQNSSSSTNKS